MSNVQETQEDPGLIIVYGDDLAIHNALGQAGAPVQQGQTAADSAQALREYVYSVVLSAPIDEDGQVVKKAVIPGGPVFFKSLFHRLEEDTCFRIIQRLERQFVTGNSTTTQWSVSVSAPPAPPLATVVKVCGGVGLGQVSMTVVPFGGGIFRT